MALKFPPEQDDATPAAAELSPGNERRGAVKMLL
jgi:hypothetical protein